MLTLQFLMGICVFAAPAVLDAARVPENGFAVRIATARAYHGRPECQLARWTPKQTRRQAVSAGGGLAWSNQRHVPELTEPICQASLRRHSWPAAGCQSVLLFSKPASGSLTG